MFKIDARKKACPLPVIETRKALRDHEQVKTIVDNEIATQNLGKLAEQLGYSCQVQKKTETEYHVFLSKQDTANEIQEDQEKNKFNIKKNDYIVAINTDKMGQGSDELGKTLLKTFIYSLSEQDRLPEQIIFYNGGATLVAEGSDVLEDLQNLINKGVKISTCGACLNYFALQDKVVVGEVTNMYRIVEIMRTTSHIIEP